MVNRLYWESPVASPQVSSYAVHVRCAKEGVSIEMVNGLPQLNQNPLLDFHSVFKTTRVAVEAVPTSGALFRAFSNRIRKLKGTTGKYRASRTVRHTEGLAETIKE